LVLELAAVDEAASVELVDDGQNGGVGVLGPNCVLSALRATIFTISTIIWLMTVIVVNVVPKDGGKAREDSGVGQPQINELWKFLRRECEKR
jgi:hypothetical protein